jgi:uncharacterized membrane protein
MKEGVIIPDSHRPLVLNTKQSWGMLIAIMALALILRLPNLGYSFYGDEAFSLLRDSNHFLTTSEDRFRPIFFTLLFLWRTLGFDGEIGLRLLPLLFGILSVPLAWTIGNRLGGRGFALGLSLLLATSPIHVEFSQELRMYSLIVFLSFAQLACYLYYRENGHFSALIWGGLVALVGMYTHLFYAFYLLGFVWLALLERRVVQFGPFLISLLAVALLYLPNLGNLFYFGAVRSTGYATDPASALPKLASALSVGFNLFSLPDLAKGRGIGWQILWQNFHYVLPCLIVFGVLIVGAMRRMFRSRRGFELNSTLTLLIVPTFLAFALQIVTLKDFTSAKYLIFLLPQALLLFAWGFQGLERRSLQLVIGGFYGLIVGVALFHFYADPVHYGRRLNWRAAAEHLKKNLDDKTPLVLIERGSYPVLRYYGVGTSVYWLRAKAPEDSIDINDYARYLRERLSGKRRVYYLREDETQNALDPKDITMKALRTLGTDEACIAYNPRLALYHWKFHQELSVFAPQRTRNSRTDVKDNGGGLSCYSRM